MWRIQQWRRGLRVNGSEHLRGGRSLVACGFVATGHDRGCRRVCSAPGAATNTLMSSDAGGSSCGRGGDDARRRRASASAQLRPRGGGEQRGSGKEEEKLTASMMGRSVGAGEVRSEQGDGGDLGDPRRKKRSGPALRGVWHRVSRQRDVGDGGGAPGHVGEARGRWWPQWCTSTVISAWSREIEREQRGE